MTVSKVFIIIAVSTVLSGCLSVQNFPAEPVPSTESDTSQTDTMYRKCKDKKRNRKDRFCVTKPLE